MFKRTREEEQARNFCRSLCRKNGTRLAKSEDQVVIPACTLWPQGVITAFHGWIDLSERLKVILEEPDLVVDGFYVVEQLEACPPTAAAPV